MKRGGSRPCASSGLEPGPAFRWIFRHWVSENEGLAELRRAQDGDQADDYQIHPGLLDSGFQLLGGVLPGAGEGIDAYVPMGVDRVQVYDRPQAAAWCRGVAPVAEGQGGRRRHPIAGRLGTRAGETGGRAAAARAARLAGPPAGRTASRLVL